MSQHAISEALGAIEMSPVTHRPDEVVLILNQWQDGKPVSCINVERRDIPRLAQYMQKLNAADQLLTAIERTTDPVV